MGSIRSLLRPRRTKLIGLFCCIVMTFYGVNYFNDLLRNTHHVLTLDTRQLSYDNSTSDNSNDNINNINDSINDVTSTKSKTNVNINITTKQIFLHSVPYYYGLKMGNSQFKDCPVKNCVYTKNSKYMTQSDAVLMYTHYQRLKAPPKKSPGQVWIFFSVESPPYSDNKAFKKGSWRNMFNWTMSYRPDSDIKFGYGEVVRGGASEKRDYFSIVKRKKKLVAWFVSKCECPSERMKYVQKLQEYVPVDIYGRCGHWNCSRDNEVICKEILERDYKFYLAFENSFCDGYVTEKLLNTSKYDVVPIVRGAANYTAVLPAKMAINTADFASIEQLADYLKHLDNDVEEYVSYLKWKEHFHIVEPQPFPHCVLCERVNNPDKWRNVYYDAYAWWMKGTCRGPTDIH